MQEYVAGIEYKGSAIEAIYHPEGRCTPKSGGGWQYEYTLKDHLGNTRLAFTDQNSDGTVQVPEDILQENHYYPFGLGMDYAWMNNAGQPDNKYQYNGKELNEDFGLNLSDYGARWYDPAVGRWGSVDPLGEKYQSWSGYNYVLGNPVKFIDPDGMAPMGDFYAVANGQVRHVGNDGNDDGRQYLVKDISSFAKDRNNLTIATTEAMLQAGTVKEISIETSGGGLSESEHYQDMFNSGDASTLSGVTEHSAALVLDAGNATLSLFRDPPLQNGPQHAVNTDDKIVTGGNPDKIILGSVHTHQAAKFFGPDIRNASVQTPGDGKAAAAAKRPVYSIDSEHVDKHVPVISPMGQMRSVPHDNIATSQAAFNGTFSILRDALKTIAPR